MKGLRSQPTHQSKQAKTGESGHESNSNLPHLDVDLDYAEEHLSHVAELVNEPPEVHIDSDSHVDLESNSKVDENSQFEPNLEGTWLQKQWMHQVRKEVVKEMNDHKGTYTKLQGGEPSLIEIIGNLNVKNVAATIEGSQWLDKLAHGQAIANTYVRPIVFLSLVDNYSCLPLWSAPINSPDSTPIYLLSVNTNHWVLAIVKDEDGVQPILPVISTGHQDVGNPCEAGPFSSQEGPCSLQEGPCSSQEGPCSC
ncbi:hypothetical protein PSTG_02302 [Puccinia striiformis f. sp. tritici PST-78]|uniref:Uncharacterized protein n=2 Tax=Puccinia striiformis TaxID=27350 RepID=A0A0L0VYP2_9BASI|nr:hypothetical protein PSTG_02302 [Puccinia striiformis f. sp. tritici PST-78]